MCSKHWTDSAPEIMHSLVLKQRLYLKKQKDVKKRYSSVFYAEVVTPDFRDTFDQIP